MHTIEKILIFDQPKIKPCMQSVEKKGGWLPSIRVPRLLTKVSSKVLRTVYVDLHLGPPSPLGYGDPHFQFRLHMRVRIFTSLMSSIFILA